VEHAIDGFKMHQKQLRRILHIAIEEASKSNMNHKHGSVIVSRNKIVAKGHNFVRINLAEKYSTHAEENAINNLYKNHRYTSLHLFVIRVMSNGRIANSKPCKNCCQCIEKNNIISKVFYSV